MVSIVKSTRPQPRGVLEAGHVTDGQEMRHLLDTNIVSRVIRGDEPYVRQRCVCPKACRSRPGWHER